MKNSDNVIMTNDDIMICYPRRIEKNQNYEVWQFGYIRDDVFYDNFDLAFIKFSQDKNMITVISEHKNRLEDTAYISRIQLLIHDISSEFDVKTVLVSDIFGNEVDLILEKLKR